MVSRKLTSLIAAALALAVVAVAIARSGSPEPQVTLSQVAAPEAMDSCTASCNAQWNQCRISTKGSSLCDQQRASCMRACVPAKKR